MNLYMYLIPLLILFTYIVIGSIYSARQTKKRSTIEIKSDTRVKFYRNKLVQQIVSTVLVLVVTFIYNAGFSDLGFRTIALKYNLWLTIPTLVACFGLLVFSISQLVRPLLSIKFRQRMRKEADANKSMASLLPRNRRERLYWTISSLFAGISEEIIFRSFLLFLLIKLLPGISPIILVIIASVLFGFGHLYQGISGVIQTSVIGMVFGFFYLTIDSILPCILMHFLVDLGNVYLLAEDKFTDFVDTNYDE